MLDAGHDHTTPIPHRLTSVVFSHYVEKARWALDRFAVPYTERKYMPFFHMLPVFLEHQGRHGRADRASSRFSTPVLRTPRGDVICDSGDIVRYVSGHYAPPGEALYDDDDEPLELEQRLHDRLGPHGRRVVYGTCFRKPELLLGLARANVGSTQAALFGASYPLAERLLRSLLAIDDAKVQRSIEVVREELAWISDLTSDGRRYLRGDRFTGADLSFACMAAPVVLPEEYGVVLPKLQQLPGDAQALVRECRATAAGQLALRLFREQRNRVVGG